MSSLSKIANAYRETGATGVIRRATARMLERVSVEIHALAHDLRAFEFGARIEHLGPYLKRNAELEGLHQGERVFVLGNGPSLARQNIDWLAQEKVMVCNAFFKHASARQIAPEYYFVTDGRLFLNESQSSEFWDGVSAIRRFSTLFVPLEYRKHSRVAGDDSIRFLALNGYLPERPLRGIELTGVVPSPPTVVQTAILAAIYMGFSEIILLGCDHNWLDDFGSDSHFYEGATAEHLPDLKDIPMRSEYSEMLAFVLNLMNGYKRIRALAEAKGCRIVNATDGGRLELFPRVRLEEIEERRRE